MQLSLATVNLNMVLEQWIKYCLIQEPKARPLFFAVVRLNSLKYIF